MRIMFYLQRRVYGDMVDKEQQINESNQMYGQLQDQLELMLDTIAKETNDIKKLEQTLNAGECETVRKSVRLKM